MNAPTGSLHGTDKIQHAISAACDSIAPTWPLDRMIAVNPYWEQIGQPFEAVGMSMAEIAGSFLTMPLSYYRECWTRGEIRRQDLEQAISECQPSYAAQQLIQALDDNDMALHPAPLLCDALDQQRDLRHEPAWADTITHQISQFCAAYFDREQADWHPDQAQGLYASWRQALTLDHSVSLLMKAPHIPAKAKSLAVEPLASIAQALARMDVPASQWSPYLQAVIMRISGWAAWCAYRRWQARLSGGDDQTLIDVLAIRLSWESLIDDGARHQGSAWNHWQEAWQIHFQNRAEKPFHIHFLWQRAHEISYQAVLFKQLGAAPTSQPSATPAVQAVFCIDVRSEIFRRHLEAQSSAIQTLGFAGFFGLPISYTPLGSTATRPQLPGLLAPALDISDSTGDAAADRKATEQRRHSLQNRLSWKPYQAAPASAFTLVETLGLSYAAKLIKRSLLGTKPALSDDMLGLDRAHTHNLRPTLKTALAGKLDAQAKLAAQVLEAMGLRDGLAPLMLLIGHGSQSQNNPQRAGLDCGACCGQTGEVNARALADLLNDDAVRAQLAKNGIHLPPRTWFIAGLHNTTTDEVRLFDTALVPNHHADALAQISAQLAAAGLAASQERAPLLGLQDLMMKPEKLIKTLKKRANDWAQTRPEWGLANNAAFVVAPRARTRGVNLAGRSFLHDYDHQKDPEGTLLELIMTAPMVVAHWINMQYHASTVDPQRYGSGNKTLHNVVGRRLGVFEGNGGDLRTGLAWQSVHDGTQWRHAPLRLSVIIDAPRAAIERIIAKHETVKSLLQNQWLYLVRFEQDRLETYRNGVWQAWRQDVTPA